MAEAKNAVVDKCINIVPVYGKPNLIAGAQKLLQSQFNVVGTSHLTEKSQRVVQSFSAVSTRNQGECQAVI